MTEKEILQRTGKRMDATVDEAKGKLATVRTGRASLALLDGVRIDYYGTPTPLSQVAKLSIPEPSLIVVQPFDPSTLQLIEKAILSSDLGLNPANDGKLMRLPIPPLTEERRKQMVKKARAMGEDSKTAVRQVRREANEEVKALEKASSISEDDAHRNLDEIQKLTDKHVGAIDELTKAKEKELMEI